MVIKSTVDGAGEFGEITPGWTISEYATPTTIGEYNGGTGGVSFSAKAEESTPFTVGSTARTRIYEDPYQWYFNAISGTILSANISGQTASITHNTPLSKYDAQFDIPALTAGTPYNALALLNNISGIVKCTSRTGGFLYPLMGHSVGFNSAGKQSTSEVWSNSVVRFQSGYGTWTDVFTSQAGSIGASGFKYVDMNPAWATFSKQVYASTVAGDSFRETVDRRVGVLSFKTILGNGGGVRVGVDAGASVRASMNDEGFGFFEFDINLTTANTATITGQTIAGGAPLNISQSASLSSLDLTRELNVQIEWVRPVERVGLHKIIARICNTSNYATAVTVTATYTALQAPFNVWHIAANVGGVRAVWREDRATELTSSFQPENGADILGTEYTPDVGFIYQLTERPQPTPTATVLQKNGWEYIQDFCSAYNVELYCYESNNGVTHTTNIALRGIGERILDITSSTTPSFSLSSVFSGRSVEIEYLNTVDVAAEEKFNSDQGIHYIDVAEIYNARDDGNRVISARAGETTTTTIDTGKYVSLLRQPKYSTNPVSGIGEYKIISSDTDSSPNVSEALWRNYGGRIDIRVNAENPTAIDIVLTGPYQEIPGYTGPYKLAYTSGNEYAALSITGVATGSGIDGKKKLKLYTTANPDKVAQEVAQTVSNPFIATLEQAYDRGLPVANKAAGPTATLSFSISSHSIDGFAATPGSLIRYKDAIYRVTDSSISGINVNVNASRFTRVQDFEQVWSNGTIGFLDDLWAGNQISDQSVKPLWFIGDDEPLILLFDSDGNPYFSFHGDSEFTMFIDSDGQIYYVEGEVEGDVNAYLDEDFRPYYGA